MTQPMLFLFAFVSTIFCAIAAVMVVFLSRTSPESKRLRDLVAVATIDDRPKRPNPFREGILRLTRGIRNLLGLHKDSQIRMRLVTAGMRGANTKDYYFAAQMAFPILFGVLASFIPSNTAFWVFALAIVGYMLPDMWLKRKTKARQKKIRRSLPDAIDLLVICVDAGLGLDQALLRVGEELIVSHPEINEEFLQVNLEQRAGKSRLDAWQSLAERTMVDELSNFVNMLVQTDRFGTPILKALTRFSEDLRQGRRQHAEQAAAKTKIKIIFPLVFCIFPCLFIVLLVPALLSITTGMKALTGN